MDLDAVGNIAEMISAIGVVATLAYLAVQIRQSATIGRANIRQQLAEQQIAYVALRVSEPLLRVACNKVFAGERLTEEEQEIFTPYAFAGMRLFESYHAQWEYGILPDEDWQALRSLYETLLGKAPFREIFIRRPQIWNPRFAALVSSIIGQAGGD